MRGTYTYQSTNPSPAEIPSAPSSSCAPPSTSCAPSARYAREGLGLANRYPRGFARRNAQSKAMRFLNRSRADLRAARKRYAAAVATVAALRVQPELPLAN